VAWAVRNRSPQRWRAPRCSPSNVARTAFASDSTPATLDVGTESLDEALEIIARANREAKPVSVGLLGNAAEVLPELLRRGVRPDAVTDQTSAHDPVNGYLPEGWTVEQWEHANNPQVVADAARKSMARHVHAMLEFRQQGIPVFDYGNNIRQVALDEGEKDAFAFPGFVPAYVRPLFCRGIGPFRWVALSGDPEDIYRTDQKVKELIPSDAHLHRWLDMARARIQFQGCRRASAGWVSACAQARSRLQPDGCPRRSEGADRDRARSPRLRFGRESQSGDRSHARRFRRGADWPLLNALLNTASGATWVSIHHGWCVGIGYSQHAGVVVVCDGTTLRRAVSSECSGTTLRAA
jgi:urocanate hydratase